MRNEFEVRDQDARSLFAWLLDKYRLSGNLIAHHQGDGWGIKEYAALRVHSGEVGLVVLSRTERRDSPEYDGLTVAWGRNVQWEQGYRWKGLRRNESLLSLIQYATYEDALEAIETR